MSAFAGMTPAQLERAWRDDAPRFARDYGIVLPDARSYLHAEFARDFDMAMDAQPTLVTTGSAGIPAFLTNFLDPRLIEVLLTPNKAAKILGEGKKGDWTTLTAMFPVVERTGEVSTYGDWNNNGSTGANVNFPQRQSYHYQTMTQWGERQLDIADKARINYAQQLNVASAIVLDKFQNESYFRGVSGLQNYGLLNEPSLSAPITPSTKTAGGVTWFNGNNPNANGQEVYNDILAIINVLIAQTKGLIDSTATMKMALSPQSELALKFTNQFNVNTETLLKTNFPNLTVESAPQYQTAAGNLVQIIVDSIDGVETGTTAFTEKMRAHAVVRDTSAWKQKKSQGTWGSIIFRPVGIAQMLGV